MNVTAQQAGEESLAAVFAALEERQSFKLEAGAGAGKTYSLIQALKRILTDRGAYLPRSDQRVACLTYTNIARDEIVARTDESPFVFANTLHGFLWEMVRPHQQALATSLLDAEEWGDLLQGHDHLDGFEIEYDLGIRGVHEEKISLHHDDIPAMAIRLFGNAKFRALIADRFPVIFIDEYQDTPEGLIEAMLAGQDTDRKRPVFGFFGDHWQQIYDKTCGSVDHRAVVAISKNANFRSDRTIVSFLNGLRPELPQSPSDDVGEGTVTIYHTNEWPGSRLTHNWKGQVSHEATRACLAWLQDKSPSRQWIQGSGDIKVLMLTHTTIANEIGYAAIPKVFKYNDSFVRKEDPVISFLVDTVEPAMDAFDGRRFGQLFDVLGGGRPSLHSPGDKAHWSNFFQELESVSANGTIGDVLDVIHGQSLFALPTRVVKRQRDMREALSALEPGVAIKEPRSLAEYHELRTVDYAEVRALRGYLENNTVFSTQHGVKGAEFDDVVVVLGRGWTNYDFAKMLSMFPRRSSLDDKERASFERSRNLFYVAGSRARHNLALLFTQELDAGALATLTEVAGGENIVSIGFADDVTPEIG